MTSEPIAFYEDQQLSVSSPRSLSVIAAAKVVLDRHTREVGFVTRTVFAASAQKGELLVATVGQRVVGFARYHVRLDHKLTVYEIAVNQENRMKGLARAMVAEIVVRGTARGVTIIQLKCPIDSSANNFYRHMGFHPSEVLRGRKRNLQVWTMTVESEQQDA
jgi:ribosomal protein S18 acetylase RimI-like enzyme